MSFGIEFLRRLSFESGQRLIAKPHDRLGGVAAEKVGRGCDDPRDLAEPSLHGRGFQVMM
jgi:hypothetical protein